MKKGLCVLLVAALLAGVFLHALAGEVTNLEKYENALEDLCAFLAYGREYDQTLLHAAESGLESAGGVVEAGYFLQYTRAFRASMMNDWSAANIALDLLQTDTAEAFRQKMREADFQARYPYLRPVEELQAYVSAREAEKQGRTAAAISYYAQCLNFYDAYERFYALAAQEGAVRAATYTGAQALMQAGEYSQASAAFAELGDFMDAADLALYCDAMAQYADKKYSSAAAKFSQPGLSEVLDAPLWGVYCKGLNLYSQKKYDQAAEQFGALSGWDRAEEFAITQRAAYCRAMAQADKKQYKSASVAFAALGDYSNAVQWACYCAALQMYADKDYSAAGKLFTALGTFQKAESYVTKCEAKLK